MMKIIIIIHHGDEGGDNKGDRVKERDINKILKII